ncbi:MAG: hypothetical protein BM557_06040 [Flavobacterium sp. MedPE-SWcel]|uniref:Ig-like domain-containing protein n=1 Tax=uncultured Flavobacterium sp. TaxID=165435 RepID=UPI00091B330E|nr:Ig-like domain-containing protein [uncultured Flavobacterium sp.]OIQ19261.1 MAG: hypothetical protein BM557_06040 [Flavobacterium sp. MedPE-SWcel]
MKKSLLLLVVLLPFISLAQNASELLVRWEGTRINWSAPSTQPMYYDAGASGSLTSHGDFTAANASGAGISFNTSDFYSGFIGTGWPTGNSASSGDYYQLAITAETGKQIELKNFAFTYKGYSKRYTVTYQKSSSGVPSDSSMLNGTALATNVNATFNNTQVAVNLTFPNNYNLLEGETLYIRVYGHKVKSSNNKWFLVHNNQQNNVANSSSVGPAIYGVVTNVASPVLDAVDDNFNANLNATTVLDILDNDNEGGAAINSVVLGAPSNGSVVLNGGNTVSYTPTTNYVGADSFTYTIANGVDPNDTATVNITVAAVTPTGPLNGTYFVGTAGHFTTITSAVDYLNTNGVSGAVTFLLTDTLYDNDSGETFPITIDQFTGTSAVNTVTFKPNTGLSVSVEGENINGSTGVPAIFKLDGADNIIFDGSNEDGGTTRNLTIKNNSDINYLHRSVIWVASDDSNGATNNTVKYVNIRQENRNSDFASTLGIYSGDNTTGGNNKFDVAATANNSDLTVISNNFTNVKQGVYVNGGSSPLTTGVVITQNDLGAENNTETVIEPAHINNVNGFTYHENYVYDLYRDTSAGSLVSSGIYVEGNSSNGVITNNEMKDLVKTTSDAIHFGGVVLESTNTNSNILVANNFILNVAGDNNGGLTANGFGISIIDGGGYKIYNNTVVLNTAQSGSGQGYSAALRISDATNVDVRNNIFANNQSNTSTNRCAILVDGNISMLSNLDYNALSSVDFIGYVGTNATDAGDSGYQATLSGWKSLSGKDANSVNILPIFVSTSNLHLSVADGDNAGFEGLGTPLADVERDIDGQIRNTTTPDIGADEFGAIELPDPDSGDGIYCASSVTWNGTSWSGTPTASTDVIFSGDYTEDAGTLYACSIFVLDGATVLFENNANAIVTHVVVVEDGSSLTFESSSNLVQIEDTANSGDVTIKRNSSLLKRLDYTIWSSPTAGSQTLLDFSPQTLTNRFYDFSATNNLFFATTPSSTTFGTAKGYLIRVPNNHSDTTPEVYNGAFEGTPNNGTIRFEMEYSGATSYNMIGNPYPSPINITKFIDENIDNIEGTIWVWRKTNDATKTTYCTINKLGYTANDALGGGGTGGNDGNTLIADPFTIISDGILNTGQGFFVRALNDNEVVFRNNMRETTNFNNFFRSANTAAQQDITNETSRYWLNVVTEDQSVFSQILVGHTAAATNGYNNGFDGRSLGQGGVSLYSILEGETEDDDIKLAIQARAAFTIDDSIKLGFTTDIAGTFEITIDHMDGLFAEGQDIYVIDNVTNTTHNLTISDYSFDSEIGTFNNRFRIVYAAEALSIDNPVLTENEVVVFQNNGTLNVNATQTIESVIVYDLLGKVVYQNMKVDNAEFTTALNIQQQVAIVMITLENQQVVSKKIMVD